MDHRRWHAEQGDDDAASDALLTGQPGEDDWWAPGTWPASELWQPSDEWAWQEPPYDGLTRPTPPGQPWYRKPALLISVIIAAMTMLVIASVVLLTNAHFGQTDEIRLRPTTRSSPAPAPTIQPAPVSAAPTSGEPTPSTEPSADSGPVGEEAPPVPAVPAPGGAVGEPGQFPNHEGPRTNVTRNPMSFTPGGR